MLWYWIGSLEAEWNRTKLRRMIGNWQQNVLVLGNFLAECPISQCINSGNSMLFSINNISTNWLCSFTSHCFVLRQVRPWDPTHLPPGLSEAMFLHLEPLWALFLFMSLPHGKRTKGSVSSFRVHSLEGLQLLLGSSCCPMLIQGNLFYPTLQKYRKFWSCFKLIKLSFSYKY